MFYYDVAVRDRMNKNNEVFIACLVEQHEAKKILQFLGRYCADFDVICYPADLSKSNGTDSIPFDMV